MPRKLLTVEEFRSSAKDGGRPDGTVIRAATGAATPVDGADRTIRFVFSDATVDRSGDSIAVDGWDITSFLENPIALWAHDSSMPPIGRASKVGPVAGKLIGDIEFMPAEMSRFADSIYQMAAGGFINAVSVGFIPLEYTFSSDKDRPYGIDFEKQELLEISVCPVPCNPNALAEARAKGIDTAPLREWAEKLLDEGSILVPRSRLEAFRKAAIGDYTMLPPAFIGADGKLVMPADTLSAIMDFVAGAKASDAEMEPAPVGNCGRAPGAACGMADPAECTVHAPADSKAIVAKGGRAVSAANATHLAKAMEHIQAVLGSNEPDATGNGDEPGAEDTGDDPAVVDSIVEDPRKAARERLAVLLN